MISVYMTFPSNEEAEKISKLLLEKRLIACANFLQSKSMYWWEGSIVNENETVVIAKTDESCWRNLKETVVEQHSYDVPCIVKMSSEANSSYSKWVEKEVQSSGSHS